MKILILGYSSIFKKRILNVFIKNNIKFCIASKSSVQKEKKAFSWYRNYNCALNQSNADLVYISLPNSFHYYWAKKALNKNYHVIVDKPISENYSQAKNLIKISLRLRPDLRDKGSEKCRERTPPFVFVGVRPSEREPAVPHLRRFLLASSYIFSSRLDRWGT